MRPRCEQPGHIHRVTTDAIHWVIKGTEVNHVCAAHLWTPLWLLSLHKRCCLCSKYQHRLSMFWLRWLLVSLTSPGPVHCVTVRVYFLKHTAQEVNRLNVRHFKLYSSQTVGHIQIAFQWKYHWPQKKKKNLIFSKNLNCAFKPAVWTGSLWKKLVTLTNDLQTIHWLIVEPHI